MSWPQTTALLLGSLLVTVFMLVPALLHLFRMWQWIPVLGVIQDIEADESGEYLIESPLVSYEFANGKYQSIYHGIKSAAILERGSTIKIKVNSKNPNKYIISGWRAALFMLAFSLSVNMTAVNLLLKQ
ncbi:DUF3592 domain-containing protein [Methylorubrum sp. SB2]|uniref:DUF3592 domain-containing protein n=1 Tax=Methylorubrum subtropicum TaxID=3138812 RepID=UPI00313A7DC1